MANQQKTTLTIEASVNASMEKVWKYWTEPNHIVNWNSAHPSWHCPKAEHDLKPGGKFSFRMEAVDGSFGFDFGGIYDVVTLHQYIEYTLGDGRKVKNTFTSDGKTTHIKSVFEAESENPIEMQQGGWQAILDNFKYYVENN
jgi:uncharacterized protein YndB with AHSA1/START domain